MASSKAAFLKHKQELVSSRRTLVMPPPLRKDDKRPRQVSPSLPELETETSLDASFSTQSSRDNESTSSASSGSLSRSSCCQESFSFDEDDDDDSLSQDETTSTTTPRRLKHTNKWYFGVGQHADKRSHGHATTTSGSRRWSQDDFEMLEHDIANGAFGHVHMARDTTSNNKNKPVALKEMFKHSILKKDNIKYVRAEVEIQTSLNHEHITKCFGYFESKTSISLVLEYASYGNLLEYMMDCQDCKVPLDEAQGLIRQVALALSHLEFHQVSHRDVKSENVLVTKQKDGHVVAKLCDFGYAVRYTHDDDFRTTLCGTPEFTPPEMITDSAYMAQFVDFWSFGVLSFELVIGRSPFYVAPRDQQLIAEERGYEEAYEVIFDEIQNFTVLKRPCTCEDDIFFDFCSRLLQLEPFDRSSATEALRHPWLLSKAEQERAMKRCKVEVSVAV